MLLTACRASFAHLDARHQVAQPQRQLFPRALQIPGWKHIIGNMLQDGLCSMSFFPNWLGKLKSIVWLMRSVSMRAALAKGISDSGFPVVAHMISKVTLPTFAHWRGGTLHACVAALSGIIDSLCTLQAGLHWRIPGGCNVVEGHACAPGVALSS